MRGHGRGERCGERGQQSVICLEDGLAGGAFLRDELETDEMARDAGAVPCL